LEDFVRFASGAKVGKMDSTASSPFAPPFLNLPREILTRHIIPQISSNEDIKMFRSVCKTWRRLMLLPSCKIRVSIFSDTTLARNVFSSSERISARGIKSQDALALLLDCVADETCSVTDLELNRCVIKEEAARKLCIAINRNTSLQSLNLEESHLGLTRVMIFKSTLQQNDNLKTIKLGVKRDSALVALLPCLAKSCRSLTELDLYCRDLIGACGVSFAEFLETVPSLGRLAVLAGRMDDAGATRLELGLAKTESLTDLNLSVHLDKLGLKSLMRGVEQNRTLQFFACYSQNVPFDDPDFVAAVCRVLEKNKTLKSFYISFSSAPVSEFLRCCMAIGASTLQSLLFGHDGYLSAEKAQGVEIILKTTLYLGYFHIHIQEGAMRSFSAGIALNRTVTHLKISSFQFSEEDWAVLGSGMSQNAFITTLSLYTLGDTPASVRVLLDALAEHPCLKRLVITCRQSFGPDSSDSFINMMARSKSLRYLCFFSTMVDSLGTLSKCLLSSLESSSVIEVDLRCAAMSQSELSELSTFSESRPGLLLLPSKPTW
jgi:hypothetical protein